jgi:RHS repeat-associated protein
VEAITLVGRLIAGLSDVLRWTFATLLLLQLALPVQAGSRITYYIHDALGSPAATLDEKGTVIERAGYLPYGGSTGATGNARTNAIDRIGFTGHVQDDTGLVYMGARYFDPVAGRFMGMDPVGFDEANPQSFNRYQYANNNPYGFVDPDGREAIPFNDSGDVKPGVGTVITAAVISSPLLFPIASVPAIVGVVTDFAAAELGFAGVGVGIAAITAKAGVRSITGRLSGGVEELLGNAGDIVVLGRQVDTNVAKNWSGHAVLDLPADEWSIAVNDKFVEAVVRQRRRVYLASPINAANVFDPVAGRSTVFGRELDQFLDAGYRRRGDYLEPPEIP